MFAVIDCGTTNTRIFIVREGHGIIASGAKKIGVRDTSITGSRQALKNGIERLFRDILEREGIALGEVGFAVASGMITSEIGLMEIPHLIAPCGIAELAQNTVTVNDPAVVDLGIPVKFIRGVRNNYGDATVRDLRRVDFMRGEEVQCVGILKELNPPLPLNVVVFSSHTKFIHIDEKGLITQSVTTMSGQIYEALKSSTNVGKSIVGKADEPKGDYSYEDIVDTACECVTSAGVVRTMLMPRFMEVLLKTTSAERDLFVDAAIMCDDMMAFGEFMGQGNAADRFVLFGHKTRCDMFEYMVNKKYKNIAFTSVCDAERINDITVSGVIAVAEHDKTSN